MAQLAEAPVPDLLHRLGITWAGWVEAVLGRDGSRADTTLAHLVAIAASLVIVGLDGAHPLTSGLLTWMIIAVGFSGLRIATLGTRIALSTLVLDAAGMGVFVAGTGSPGSPFYLLALAGIWWAAHVATARGVALYGAAFMVVYLPLVVPGTLGTPAFGGAIEELVVLVGIAILAQRFVRIDQRALTLNDALECAPFGMEQLALREGLVRALHTMNIPVDVVLAAGQVGLTAVQAELLSYLMLGLSNFEISDAAGVSEATVRYRLTRLYRTLGVRGRRDAAQRARDLGLAAPDASPSTKTVARQHHS